MDHQRRKILKQMAILPFLKVVSSDTAALGSSSLKAPRISFSVNAYSFNAALSSGEMTLFDMMDHAAEIGLNAVDLTAYYFPGYPKVPNDDYLFKFKRKALKLGLDISWTGVRNNFATSSTEARQADIAMIENWAKASAKLGAPIMRIFAGRGSYENHSKETVKEWMVEDLKTCATIAGSYGLLLGLQHHNDFLFSSTEVIDILERVNSEWLGLILDIGSLHGDTYAEIEQLAPYADYWFIKEYVYPNGKKAAVDMQKIAQILRKSNYKGYVSFESLSDGDPKQIVAKMFADLQAAL